MMHPSTPPHVLTGSAASGLHIWWRTGRRAKQTGSFNSSLTSDSDGAWVDGWNDARNAVEGWSVWITSETSRHPDAGTSGSLHVSFLVNGQWTDDTLVRHFASVSPGNVTISQHDLSNTPSAMRLRLSGTDNWSFYSIKTTQSRSDVTTLLSRIQRVLTVNPHGNTGTVFPPPLYWLDPSTQLERTWQLTAAESLTSDTAAFARGTHRGNRPTLRL
jgi:hypothetical protein